MEANEFIEAHGDAYDKRDPGKPFKAFSEHSINSDGDAPAPAGNPFGEGIVSVRSAMVEGRPNISDKMLELQNILKSLVTQSRGEYRNARQLPNIIEAYRALCE